MKRYEHIYKVYETLSLLTGFGRVVTCVWMKATSCDCLYPFTPLSRRSTIDCRTRHDTEGNLRMNSKMKFGFSEDAFRVAKSASEAL